ncbi:MAG: ATP-dependent RNA helicase HrpA [Syntrophales bacterium]|nr:ATP-dependent RNA helicase HrpA [Syntrophales bacterium]MDY0045361.1 ATP-dependent RNA helicase HrpA [Syntrophales bacterium]
MKKREYPGFTSRIKMANTDKKSQIEQRISKTLRKDRFALLSAYGRIKNLKRKKIDQSMIDREMNVFKKKLERAEQSRHARIAGLPRVTYPAELPITEKREEIVEAIRRHRVIVVTGETGSGKTTQLPKMCIEAGCGIEGVIGCTQPRRIAALSIARRLAEELGEPAGRSVGYKIRFNDRTDPRGYIKFMTDGILLMEAQSDRLLYKYDTLIIDEAHERSINIDFILGILKGLIEIRKDLRLIITSATIDPQKFSYFFNDAPVIEVSGRMYPVEIRYRPVFNFSEDDSEANLVDAAVKAVKELKKEHRQGHALIFMPTEQDIRETCEVLEGKNYKNSIVLPLFGRLAAADQERIFYPTREDKLIVATNVAETSITIPGIRYVVDTGLARISEYNAATRTKGLPVKPVSRSSALQRAGRCGRMQSGICVRLYSEEDYEERPLFTPPEILRSNLAEVILRMMILKIGDMSDFPFIDPPRPKAVKDGYDILKELGAIRAAEKGFVLTGRGKEMARLPLDPRIARMILEAEHQKCVDEILIIAAALSIQDPRERPFEKEAAADEAHRCFQNPSSDFAAFLTIWKQYHTAAETKKTKNQMRKFCRENFLSYRRMKEWCDIYEQLGQILNEGGSNYKKGKKSPHKGEAFYEAVHKSIIAGYLSQTGLKKEKNIYRTARGQEVMIFPGSCLFNKGHDWIVAAETVETSRVFARTAACVKSEWLEETGKEFCRYHYSEPRWDRERGEVIASEQVTLYGLPLVANRIVSYGRINPEEATEIFIRRALVEGDIDTPFSFLQINRKLIHTVVTMENKIRRRNILVSDDDLTEFYKERLGIVFDIRTLKKIVKDKNNDDFLKMTEEDIRKYLPEEDILARYPDTIVLDRTPLRVTYRFSPGSAKDGATIRIPTEFIANVPSDSADWHIPGLLEEKITALIKGLPKEYRKQLIPISRTVQTVIEEITSGSEKGSLLAELAKAIHKRFGVAVPATVWPAESIPEHLKIRYALTDRRGKVLKASRNMDDLKEHAPKEKESPLFEKALAEWKKEGLAAWNFGDIPERISIGGSTRGIPSVAYPGLEDERTSVSVTLYHSEEEARGEHEKGVKRLYLLQYSKELKYLRQCLSLPSDLKAVAAYFRGKEKFEEALFNKALCLLVDCTTRNQKEFHLNLEKARSRIHETAHSIITVIEPVFRYYNDLRRTLNDLEESRLTNKKALSFIEEIRKELRILIPDDFPNRYDVGTLSQLPRYIRALAVRAERGIVHLEKDSIKAEKLRFYTSILQEIENTLPSFTSKEKKQAIEDLRWMIEEYKISLFAPEIKTLSPVSPKRLNKKIEDVQKMI